MAGQILEVGALIYKLFVQFLIMQHLQIIALKEATLFVVIFKDANYSKKGLSGEKDLGAKPNIQPLDICRIGPILVHSSAGYPADE